MLIDAHQGAVEYELLRLGLRLRDIGTGRCDWSDVRAVVLHAGPTSAIARAIRGHDWTQDTALLAAAVDLLALANWQRQGKKTAPKPKPVPRPVPEGSDRRIGADPVPVSTFDDWWAGRNDSRRR